MDEKMKKIVLDAGNVFMRYGIKSVTMDDIARELKISKKTLYKYVNDKLDLVCKVCSSQCEMERGLIAQIHDEKINAIDELIRMSKYVSEQLREIHPSIHYDLEKYYPEAWQIFIEHKESFIMNCLKTNMELGIKEGLYRDNLNPEIIAKLYVAKLDLVFDPAVFPINRFSFTDVHMQLVRYHIRGVASDKGIAYLQTLVNNNTT